MTTFYMTLGLRSSLAYYLDRTILEDLCDVVEELIDLADKIYLSIHQAGFDFAS